MSDKVILRDKINLSENSQIIKSELETAELLENFFSNIIKNFEISKFSNYKPFIDNTEDKTLRAILEYKNHPRILLFKISLKMQTFYLTELEVTDIEKEIKELNTKKKLVKILIFPSKLLKKILIYTLNFCVKI